MCYVNKLSIKKVFGQGAYGLGWMHHHKKIDTLQWLGYIWSVDLFIWQW